MGISEMRTERERTIIIGRYAVDNVVVEDSSVTQRCDGMGRAMRSAGRPRNPGARTIARSAASAAEHDVHCLTTVFVLSRRPRKHRRCRTALGNGLASHVEKEWIGYGGSSTVRPRAEPARAGDRAHGRTCASGRAGHAARLPGPSFHCPETTAERAQGQLRRRKRDVDTSE